MDSKDYFKKAEIANKRYHHFMVGLGLFVTAALTVTILILFKINSDNHARGTQSLNTIIQNEDKLNDNLESSIKCILLLTPQTYNPQSVNACFAGNQTLTTPKAK